MIQHLQLRAIDGTELHLFDVYKHPEGEHLEADAYVALKAQPEGTVYTIPVPDGRLVRLRAEQPIHVGLWAYPGDSRHFGRLFERPLFYQIGVFYNGSPQKAAGPRQDRVVGGQHQEPIIIFSPR